MMTRRFRKKLLAVLLSLSLIQVPVAGTTAEVMEQYIPEAGSTTEYLAELDAGSDTGLDLSLSGLDIYDMDDDCAIVSGNDSDEDIEIFVGNGSEDASEYVSGNVSGNISGKISGSASENELPEEEVILDNLEDADIASESDPDYYGSRRVIYHGRWENPYIPHTHHAEELDDSAYMIAAYGDVDIPVYDNKNEAALAVRAGLLNNEEQITVHFKYPRKITMEEYQTIIGSIVGEEVESLMDIVFEHTGVSTEGDYLNFRIGGMQYPAGVIYYENGDLIIIVDCYDIEYSSSREQEEYLGQCIDQFFADNPMTGKTKYEKFRTIYDYITNNVEYDFTNLNDDSYVLKYTAYAAMVNHTAVCQGYAELLYRMLLEAGIDCRFIGGIGNGGPHAWNIVQMNNLYYNCDATWDADLAPYGIPYKYCLVSEAEFYNHYRDLEFATAQFYEKHPMASKSFDPATDDVDTEPETEPETESETETETEKETEKITEPETESESETEKATEKVTEKITEPETESESETEKATEPETEKVTEKITEPETESESETEKVTEKITEPETESESETEKATEPETEKATEKVTEKITEPETESETESETEKVTEKVTEKITEPETESESETEKATEKFVCEHTDLVTETENYVDATYEVAGSYDQVSYCEVCKEEIERKTIAISKKVLGTPSLTSVVNGKTGVDFTWKSVKEAQGYVVYRKQDKGSWTKLAKTTKTSYIDTTAKTGIKYYYSVAALVNGETKEVVGKYNTTGKYLTYVKAPKISSAKNSSSKKIAVKWGKVSSVTGYQLRYKTGTKTKTVTITKGTTVSKTISSLTKKKTYAISIRSYKTISKKNYYSAWSDAKSVKVTK